MCVFLYNLLNDCYLTYLEYHEYFDLFQVPFSIYVSILFPTNKYMCADAIGFSFIEWGVPVMQRYGDEYVKVLSVKGQTLDGYHLHFFFKKSVGNEVKSIGLNAIQTT